MKRALIVMALVAVLAALSGATTLVPMSVEQMSRSATHIVHARALISWTEWNPQHTLLYTYTRFEVLSELKGLAPATLIVKQMGGARDGIEQKVAGVRHFASGEEDVLFLRPSIAADGDMVVVGLVQGRFRVLRSPTGEPVVSNAVPGVLAYRPGAHATSAYSGGRMTLSQLESRIRKAVQR